MPALFRTFAAVALAAALAAPLGGCATLMRSSTTRFYIDTYPRKAQVRTSIGPSCASTPCELRISRKATFTVTVSKAGYATSETRVSPRVGTVGMVALVGDVLGGLVGLAIDSFTGALNDLDPNPLHAVLDPLPGTDEAGGR